MRIVLQGRIQDRRSSQRTIRLRSTGKHHLDIIDPRHDLKMPIKKFEIAFSRKTKNENFNSM